MTIVLEGCSRKASSFCADLGRELTEAELVERAVQSLPGAITPASPEFDRLSEPEKRRFEQVALTYVIDLKGRNAFLEVFPDCCRTVPPESLSAEGYPGSALTRDRYKVYRGFDAVYFVPFEAQDRRKLNVRMESKLFINNCGSTAGIGE